MKAIIKQSELNKAMKAVLPAVPTKATLPALTCVYMLTDGDTATFVTTDLEKAIRISIPASVDIPGATLIPARLFAELVAATPNEQVTLELKGGDTLEYRYGKSSSKFKVLDVESFPQIPTAGVVERGWNALQLMQAINLTVFSAATSEDRPTLAGILFEYNSNGTLLLAGADGFRLSVHTSTVSISQPSFRTIIPARSLSELVKLLSAGGNVGIAATEHQVIFTLEGAELVTNTIEGNYPDARQLLPKESPTRVTVNRATLKAAVSRVHIFAREGTSIIRMMVANGEMTLKGRGTESGESVETIDAITEGPSLEGGFNGKFLLEVLSALPTEQVVFNLRSVSSPALLEGVGLEGYSHVLMPMHLPEHNKQEGSV